jgi:hypothetical protein
MQQEQEMQERDISFELRKLIALNFPALMHILCSHCIGINVTETSSHESSDDSVSDSSEEEHKQSPKKTLK